MYLMKFIDEALWPDFIEGVFDFQENESRWSFRKKSLLDVFRDSEKLVDTRMSFTEAELLIRKYPVGHLKVLHTLKNNSFHDLRE